MKNQGFLFIFLLLFTLSVSFLPMDMNAAGQKQRNYMLVFQVNNYSVQLKEAVTHFVSDVLQRGDQLIIVTPMKLVGYSPAKLNRKKGKLISEILDILKKDISNGSSRQRAILAEMKQIALMFSRLYYEISENSANDYVRLRKDLSVLNGSYQERLIKYARIFRKVRGDNHLLMFLQQEFRPIPDKETMNIFQARGSSASRKVVQAFLGESINQDFNLNEVKRHFRYANIRFHFFYLKDRTLKQTHKLDYLDNLGEIYGDFSKLSTATNGIKLTGSKPQSFVDLIQKVVKYGTVSTEVVDQEME
jgi:hypothetical protein